MNRQNFIDIHPELFVSISQEEYERKFPYRDIRMRATMNRARADYMMAQSQSWRFELEAKHLSDEADKLDRLADQLEADWIPDP